MKKQSTFVAYITMLCTTFLHTIPTQITPANLPQQTIKLEPVAPHLSSGIQLHNNINASTQPSQSKISFNTSLSMPIFSPVPVPINQKMKNQLKQTIKTQPMYPRPPQDHKKLKTYNGPITLAVIVAAGIAHLSNNTNPTPQPIRPTLQTSHTKYDAQQLTPQKTGIDHIIDQQYAQLEKIAIEYEHALYKNTFYYSGKYRTRIQERIDAIKEWQSNPHKNIKASQLNRAFLHYSHRTSSAYTTITADPVQRALHKEIVSIGNELANFQTLDPQISGYLFNHATLLMEISRSYTGSNIIVQAMNAADVCWEIIEAAHITGSEVLFSKEIESVWQHYFVYSQAQVPTCTIDWDQFEWEKTRWYAMQKQCEKLVEGCTVFIQNSQLTVENHISTVGNSLSRIATTIDNFLLNEVVIKIDSFCRLLGRTTLNIAQQCKEKLANIVQASKDMVVDFVQDLYSQIAGLANSGIAFATGIAMNAITLYLLVGLFSNGENPIELKTAAILSVVMKLIYASGSSSTLIGSVAQTLLYTIKTNPIQALIIGAALLTPVISPLIEEYTNKQKTIPQNILNATPIPHSQ